MDKLQLKRIADSFLRVSLISPLKDTHKKLTCNDELQGFSMGGIGASYYLSVPFLIESE